MHLGRGKVKTGVWKAWLAIVTAASLANSVHAQQWPSDHRQQRPAQPQAVRLVPQQQRSVPVGPRFSPQPTYEVNRAQEVERERQRQTAWQEAAEQRRQVVVASQQAAQADRERAFVQQAQERQQRQAAEQAQRAQNEQERLQRSTADQARRNDIAARREAALEQLKMSRQATSSAPRNYAAPDARGSATGPAPTGWDRRNVEFARSLQPSQASITPRVGDHSIGVSKNWGWNGSGLANVAPSAAPGVSSSALPSSASWRERNAAFQAGMISQTGGPSAQSPPGAAQLSTASPTQQSSSGTTDPLVAQGFQQSRYDPQTWANMEAGAQRTIQGQANANAAAQAQAQQTQQFEQQLAAQDAVLTAAGNQQRAQQTAAAQANWNAGVAAANAKAASQAQQTQQFEQQLAAQDAVLTAAGNQQRAQQTAAAQANWNAGVAAANAKAASQAQQTQQFEQQLAAQDAVLTAAGNQQRAQSANPSQTVNSRAQAISSMASSGAPASSFATGKTTNLSATSTGTPARLATAGKASTPAATAALSTTRGLGTSAASARASASQAAEISQQLPSSLSDSGNVVYRALNADGETIYVGITNNFTARAGQQLRAKGIEIEPIEGLDGLARSDARAVEQVLIKVYGLGKDGGTLLNKINSIAKDNSIYDAAVQRGAQLLADTGLSTEEIEMAAAIAAAG
jgi:hypothetical protein